MGIDTGGGYNPEAKKQEVVEGMVENKETGSKDSAEVANHAEEGIRAIKGKEIEVARFHARECYKMISEDTDPKSLDLAEDFAKELSEGEEDDFGQELIKKIDEIREKVGNK